MSIGALNLISSNPAGSSNPTSSLLTGIILFMFSFLVLIGVWLRYSDIMTFLPVEDRRSRDLNIALLFLVALEPYLFNQLFGYGSLGSLNGVGNPLVQGSFLDVSTTLFALDIGTIFGILALFTNLLAQEEKNLVELKLLSYYRQKECGSDCRHGILHLRTSIFLDSRSSTGTLTILFLARTVFRQTRDVAPQTERVLIGLQGR